MKARAPAIQLYFRDWMSHPGLRMCEIAARGLWTDMMCIMAEGTPYGYLAVNGKGILPAALARRVGESLPDVERWLTQLEEHEVFARDEHKVIYSPRMVRAELLRQVRGAGGHKSQEHPNVPRRKDREEGGAKDIPEDVGKDTIRPSPAVAVASAVAVPSIHPPAIERFLAELPDDQKPEHWSAIINGWRQGMGFEGGKAATGEDIATGLTEYLAGAKRDFAVIHVRSFVERAYRNRLKSAARNNGHSTDQAARVWDLIKSRGIQHRTSQSEIDIEVQALVDEGAITSASAFKTILKKLDFDTLRKAQTPAFAVKHIAEKMNGSARKVA